MCHNKAFDIGCAPAAFQFLKRAIPNENRIQCYLNPQNIRKDLRKHAQLTGLQYCQALAIFKELSSGVVLRENGHQSYLVPPLITTHWLTLNYLCP